MAAKFQIKKATKAQSRARVGLVGPSGSGKTWTALALATGLGSNIVVIDTENGSASKYADVFDFNVLVLEDFAPQTYVEAIRYCEQQGFDVIVVDSLSHAWMGKGGALEQVDHAAKRLASRPGQRENTFAAWRDVTPHHNALVDALVRCKTHLICTMRAKTDYVMETDAKGRTAPRKVGLAPVQRDGMEYEFDIVADIDVDHNLVVSKTRCSAIDGAVIGKPGRDLGETIRAWLSDGVEAPACLPAEAPRPKIAPYEERASRDGPRSEVISPHQRARLEELGSTLNLDTLNYEQAKAELARLLNPQDRETAIQVARGMIATAIARGQKSQVSASPKAMQDLHVALAGWALHTEDLREDVIATLVRSLEEGEPTEAEASALTAWLNNGNNARLIDLIWPPEPQQAPAVTEFQGEAEAVL